MNEDEAEKVIVDHNRGITAEFFLGPRGYFYRYTLNDDEMVSGDFDTMKEAEDDFYLT